MSGRVYRAYRVVNEEQRLLLNSQLKECCGICMTDDVQFQLDIQPAGGSVANEYCLKSSNTWDAKKHDAMIGQKIVLSVDGLKNLYEGDSRIACKDYKLGVAAVWQCTGSGLNGCRKMPFSFNYADLCGMTGETCTVSFEVDFPAGVLSGLLKVEYIVYLVAAGSKAVAGISNIPGTRLGKIADILTLQIDGDSSVFPITNVYSPSGPLWYVKDSFSEIDLLRDEFNEEAVSLVLNEAHRDFSLLGQNKDYKTPLFTEIFASALEEIIRRADEEDRDHDLWNESVLAEEGSVAAALRYMKSVFNLRIDTPNNLHEDIRRAVKINFRDGDLT